MTDAFLTLGAAVVKAALQVWFKDDVLVAQAGVSIVDLVKSKISGQLEQRRAQRLFEDLEVPVANRLRSIRTTEFSAMPENEWRAAVLASAISFDRANLNARELLTRDLDPLSLEQLIRAHSRSATRDLSSDGTALYNRIISEACSHVIEIADKLPSFQVGAIAELLRRDREIIELISEVLDLIPKRLPGEDNEARFVTAYLRHIATRLDRLELFGLDFASPWYPLSIAYVSLQASEQAWPARRIEDSLAENSRLMVFGNPGSGKTTVLQWIAVRAARSDFQGGLSIMNGYIPFVIRLREYARKELPAPEDFIANIAPMLASEMPVGWIRSQLRTGRSFVLVDGVDELPYSQRNEVSRWLEDLTDLFPDARYVVTSRHAALPPVWLEGRKFRRVSLEAMPPSLVNEFIGHWYEAARYRETDNEERERLNGYERSLLMSVDDDRYLRDLADTPLLAGLLCALNRHLRSQLPRRRSEIYDRAMVMFDQRDRVRRIVVGVDLDVKSHLLADLAFWMVRNELSEVDAETLQNLIGRSLANLTPGELTPEAVYNVLLERSGLLREPSAGRIDFIHRTFQEYLAARAAIDDDAIGELIRNADDVQWRQVVLFSAGQANDSQASRLVQGLLRPSSSGERRILTIGCLREVRSLRSVVRQNVMSLLPSLLPPQSMDQAKELSAVGTALIPLLSKNWARDLSKAPETIRVSSLIGGSAALDLIESVVSQYHLDDRNLDDRNVDPMIREVERASQYFDASDYRRVDDILKWIVIDDAMRSTQRAAGVFAGKPQLVIICGWQGARAGTIGSVLEGADDDYRLTNTIGSLLVGVYDDDRLRYAGNVSIGFTEEMLAELMRKLRQLQRATSPFVTPVPQRYARGVHWVEPRLVGEVIFTEWTTDGSLRDPTWYGLRIDNNPGDVDRVM
jgi:hypothetical protein